MKNYLKLGLYLLLFTTAFIGCEEDLSFNANEKQSKYKTVLIDEAKNFLESHRTSSFTKSNDLDLNYDIELAAHEAITNSNELLTVIPATTKYTNHYSRILLLKVNEEIQSVVFSMHASDNSSTSNYSGELLITDLDGNFINGWRIENNEYITQFVKKEETQNKNFAKNNEGESCPVHGECETVTVDCVICGFTLDEVTVVASSPKPFPYVPTEGIYEEGGSSGGGGNTSSGGDSSDSNGNETENSWAANNCGEGNIADENGNCVEETSYPYPHCSSFEYYKPPGAIVTACAVTNLNDTFYAQGELNGVPGDFEVPVNYPLIYFTMPSWRTNGNAATLTAIAVNKALNATQVWFEINYDATETEIGDKLDSNLIKEMGKFSGSMSGVPPFSILNPTPYQTSLFSTGNCD